MNHEEIDARFRKLEKDVAELKAKKTKKATPKKTKK